MGVDGQQHTYMPRQRHVAGRDQAISLQASLCRSSLGRCKSSYIRAPKARESLGFYPKSYSGFGSSRSCAPPLVDDSALSPEELGSSPARIVQLSRSHGGKVDSRIGTRKRESPGRPYPREGEECKSSYIRAPKARESLGFYPKSYRRSLDVRKHAEIRIISSSRTLTGGSTVQGSAYFLADCKPCSDKASSHQEPWLPADSCRAIYSIYTDCIPAKRCVR